MNRKSIVAILIFCMLLIGIVGLYASDFSVKIDPETPNAVEATSIEINGINYFGVSELKESFNLDLKVRLDVDNNKSLLFKNEFYELEFTETQGYSNRMDSKVELGENSGFLTYEKEYYIPVKAIAKAMSYGFTLDNANHMIYLLSNREVMPLKEEQEPVSRYAKYNFTNEDKLWLARIVYVEARDGSVLKKIAVANVVLNRVRNSRFPDTPYEVIFQKGQFPPAHKAGFSEFIPPDEAFEAVERAIAGENNVDESLYFNMVKFNWKPDSDYFGNIEGDHFYY